MCVEPNFIELTYKLINNYAKAKGRTWWGVRKKKAKARVDGSGLEPEDRSLFFVLNRKK